MSSGTYVRVTRPVAVLSGAPIPAGTIGRVLDAPSVGEGAAIVEVPMHGAVVLTSDDVEPSSREAWDAQRDTIGLRATEPRFG